MNEKSIDLSNIVIPESVDNAITNMTDKPTKNIGTTFGDLWYLVFGGISFKADKKRIKYQLELEKFEKECREEIDKIPVNKRVVPDTQTAAMALEAAKYCVENETIRKMFAKLISATMNRDTEDLSHPSFPNILKQMDSLEAEIIEKFAPNKEFPICEYRAYHPSGDFNKLNVHIFLEDICLTDYKTIEKRAIAIASLARLGLLDVDYSHRVENNSLYEPFYQTKLLAEYRKIYTSKKLKLKKGIVLLTPLGKQFLAVCCPEKF